MSTQAMQAVWYSRWNPLSFQPTVHGLMPGDQGGFTPTHAEWLSLVAEVERFYSSITDSTIAASNAAIEASYDYHPKSQPQPSPGYVYVAKASNNLFKIGQSKAPITRLTRLSATIPEGLQIVLLIKSATPRILERDLHQRFSAKRGNGEWFQLDSSDIAYMRSLCDAEETP